MGTKNKFNELFCEAVDEALNELGEKVASSLYTHLESRFNIKKKEIPNKINEFSDALDKIFGIGARNLEILFMKKLHSKINGHSDLKKWVPKEANLTFNGYVNSLKECFEKKKNNLEVYFNEWEKQKFSKKRDN